jgi:hypothetical protein
MVDENRRVREGKTIIGTSAGSSFTSDAQASIASMAITQSGIRFSKDGFAPLAATILSRSLQCSKVMHRNPMWDRRL